MSPRIELHKEKSKDSQQAPDDDNKMDLTPRVELREEEIQNEHITHNDENTMDFLKSRKNQIGTDYLRVLDRKLMLTF